MFDNIEVFYDAVVAIMLHSAKGTRTWTFMELVGFKTEDFESKKQRNCAKRKREIEISSGTSHVGSDDR